MENTTTLPSLSSEEIRVLGSLIEKSKTTPDYYPMSLNALTAACNQKTSRHPVVDYDEQTVQTALNSLKGQSLVANAIGGGSRTMKFKHNFTTVFEVSQEELSILCLLTLRGPQTPGELNTNAHRMIEFKSLEAVHEILEKLRQSHPPFVKELPKRAGQKETRFVHLLSGEPREEFEDRAAEEGVNDKPGIEERLEKLEMEVARMKEVLDKLENGLL